MKNLTAKSVRVGSIWIADCAWQGQSGILNQDKLGDDREFEFLMHRL